MRVEIERIRHLDTFHQVSKFRTNERRSCNHAAYCHFVSRIVTWRIYRQADRDETINLPA